MLDRLPLRSFRVPRAFLTGLAGSALALAAWTGIGSADPAAPTTAPSPGAPPAAAATQPVAPTTGPTTGPTTNPTTISSTLAALPPGVADLLQQLGDDDWHKRQAAQRKLLSLGEPVRPELERMLKSDPSPEMAQRLQTLIAVLDESKRLGFTLVTLHLKDAKPADAVAELGRRSGVPIAPLAEGQLGDIADKRVTYDCENQPFWTALTAIATQAGLRFAGLDAAGANAGAAAGGAAGPAGAARKEAPARAVVLTPVDVKITPAPTAVAGPFLIVIGKVEQTRVKEFAAPGQLMAMDRGCHVFLAVWSEPKMTHAQWSIDRVNELLTDEGKVALDASWAGFAQGSVNETWMSDVRLAPTLPGKKIKRIAVTASFTVELKRQTWEVDQVLQSGTTVKTIGDLKYTLTDVKKTADDQYSFTVQVEPAVAGNAQAFMRYRRMLNENTPRLLDDKGQEPQSNGRSITSGNTLYRETIRVNCTANGVNPKVGEPVKFVWEIPSEVRTLTYPVEFTDVPLP